VFFTVPLGLAALVGLGVGMSSAPEPPRHRPTELRCRLRRATVGRVLLRIMPADSVRCGHPHMAAIQATSASAAIPAF
jgi:hypothetical protein